MNTQIDRLRELICRYGFDKSAGELTALLEPSVLIRISRTALDNFPLGASRFGGNPDLPATMPWPAFRGQPLTLIAQLCLEDFVPYDLKRLLPKTGWLCLFLYPELNLFDQGDPDCQVVYFDDEFGRLSRRQPDDGVRPFPACRTELSGCYTLPDRSSMKAAAFVDTAERWDLYGDLLLELRQMGVRNMPAEPRIPRLRRIFHGAQPYGFHQALGYPERDNLDPETIAQCLRGAGRPRAVAMSYEPSQDWVLLLDVRSDDNGLGVTWGSSGRLLFIIRRQDLLERRFEAVELVTTYA